MKSPIFQLGSVLVAACLPMAGQAEAFSVLTVDFPPFAYLDKGAPKGVLVDCLREVEKITGDRFVVEFLPWKRAQVSVSAGKDMLIIDVNRSPERERQFKWIGEMGKAGYVLYTLKTGPAVKTIEQARRLSVGYMVGSASEPLVKRLGFAVLEAVRSQDLNAKKLNAGRIDAWVVRDIGGPFIYQSLGYDTNELSPPFALEPVSDLWLAGSLDFSDAKAKRLAKALKQVRGGGPAGEPCR